MCKGRSMAAAPSLVARGVSLAQCREIRTANEPRDLAPSESQKHSLCRNSYFRAVLCKPRDVNGGNWIIVNDVRCLLRSVNLADVNHASRVTCCYTILRT